MQPAGNKSLAEAGVRAPASGGRTTDKSPVARIADPTEANGTTAHRRRRARLPLDQPGAGCCRRRPVGAGNPDPIGRHGGRLLRHPVHGDRDRARPFADCGALHAARRAVPIRRCRRRTRDGVERDRAHRTASAIRAEKAFRPSRYRRRRAAQACRPAGAAILVFAARRAGATGRCRRTHYGGGLWPRRARQGRQRRSSPPADPTLCRSGWSIRAPGASAPASAPAPAIPVRRLCAATAIAWP